jgi:hypothetical protein
MSKQNIKSKSSILATINEESASSNKNENNKIKSDQDHSHSNVQNLNPEEKLAGCEKILEGSLKINFSSYVEKKI